MKLKAISLLGGLVMAATHLALARNAGMRIPASVEAGNAFSIQCTVSGKAVLYIVGPGQALRRDVQQGETIYFRPGELHNAGHYLAILQGTSSTYHGEFDVVSQAQPADLSFLAKPTRLTVGLQDAISGVVYVFDTFHNLVLLPAQVTFELSGSAGGSQTRTVITRNGVAWTRMNSTAKEGSARFVARAGTATGTRVIQQVPGDPCRLNMSARQLGKRIMLKTEPVRDCGGNAVPDGTIVTFTETYDGGQATVDVPLKRGIAITDLPVYNGARISVATGVVLGNEIRWGKE